MRLGIGIGIGQTRGGASGPALNAPTLVVQEGGVDTHAESEPADLDALTTVDDSDGFPTTLVRLWDGASLIGSMTDAGSGSWNSGALLDDTPAGSYSFRAERVTASGSVFSAPWAVVVSGVAGNPVIAGPGNQVVAGGFRVVASL